MLHPSVVCTILCLCFCLLEINLWPAITPCLFTFPKKYSFSTSCKSIPLVLHVRVCSKWWINTQLLKYDTTLSAPLNNMKCVTHKHMNNSPQLTPFLAGHYQSAPHLLNSDPHFTPVIHNKAPSCTLLFNSTRICQCLQTALMEFRRLWHLLITCQQDN